jgi:nucleoid-associated protein YgaU
MALLKGMLMALDPPNLQVEFQYNPTKYTVSKSLNWNKSDDKGKDAPALEYVRGEGRSISLELFLDDYEGDGARSVVDRVAELEQLTKPLSLNMSFLTRKPRPPRVMFQWANPQTAFTAVISQMNVSYTMFHPEGRPARATVSLTLKEWPTKLPFQNPTSHGATGIRSHRVVGGETLEHIAYQELGAATHWRHIAELNNIDDPLSLESGQYLVIKPLR